jgi:hypothetical protein
MNTKRSPPSRKADRTRKRARPHGPYATRRRAAIKALFQWPWGTLTTGELARGSREAARRRPAAERRRAARKAVRTKGPRLRRQAARQAARTRARG